MNMRIDSLGQINRVRTRLRRLKEELRPMAAISSSVADSGGNRRQHATTPHHIEVEHSR